MNLSGRWIGVTVAAKGIMSNATSLFSKGEVGSQGLYLDVAIGNRKTESYSQYHAWYVFEYMSVEWRGLRETPFFSDLFDKKGKVGYTAKWNISWILTAIYFKIHGQIVAHTVRVRLDSLCLLQNAKHL